MFRGAAKNFSPVSRNHFLLELGDSFRRNFGIGDFSAGENVFATDFSADVQDRMVRFFEVTEVL